MMWTIRKSIKKGEYVYAKVPEHPHATKNGYVLYHRIVMENKLGRLLTQDEVVHHKNENKKDNSIENLEVMGSREHVGRHTKNRGVRTVVLRCPSCGSIFERRYGQTHLVRSRKALFTSCSHSCKGSFASLLTREGILSDVVSAALETNVIRVFQKKPPW